MHNTVVIKIQFNKKHYYDKLMFYGKDSYCCDCLDGGWPLVEDDDPAAAVDGPLAIGVGACKTARRGKCLMFTPIPSSTTSSTPVWQGVPFLSRTILSFKL